MEEALTSYLLGTSALTARVGQRINWDERPQLEALPAITLSISSAPVAYHHGGRRDLQRVRVQADVWGSAPGEVLAAKRALITAVEAINTAAPVGVMHGAFIENDFTAGREDMGGGGRVFRRIVEFFVWHVGQ